MYHIGAAELQLLFAGVQTGSLRDSLGIAPDNDEYLQPLMNCYLLLTHYPERIINHFPAMSQNDLLYNRYYWFVKYKNEYQARCGYDAGLEQQAFKLLEEIDRVLKGEIDWAIIQKIDDELGKKESD
jgi:hypothetical protein